MNAIRVLVAEDSLTIRKRLCEILAAAPDIEVVGEAADGKQAIELCGELRPNVVTMDMMMPVMTGLAATEYIMAYFPTPILIVSSSTNRQEVFKTLDALAAGALDVLDKPIGDEPDGAWESKLIATIKLLARIRVITHPRARLSALKRPSLPPEQVQRTPRPGTGPIARRTLRLVAIGASTGGPGAIVEILRTLPANFRLPVLLVMHINEPFGTAFAEWLDGQVAMDVRYARDGELLADITGCVAMAPPDWHLVVRNERLHLTKDAERNFCRPSVDILFESLAREQGAVTAACLLTGMGRDGAGGLLDIRHAGGLTIAQDEATCVVYGMPREAIIIGAAERVLPLDEIGPAVAALSAAALEGSS